MEKSRIDFELNPSLTFTLADHINFSIIRLENKIDVTNPLTNDIKYLYKTEMEIGYKGLEIIKNELGIDFPSCEASSIALHIKNAEGLENDMPNTIENEEFISEEMIDLLEKMTQEEWLRHKIRCIIIKQWKKPMTIYRNLMKLNKIFKCKFSNEDIFKCQTQG